MLRILFCCYGNICRSPMAEYVMKELVRQAGLSQQFEIASAATSGEEVGNPIYPLSLQQLQLHHIPCAHHASRQLTKADYQHYDWLIGMDNSNLRHMNQICGQENAPKIRSLLSFTSHPGEVADPWFTRDFGQTWEDVSRGCAALLQYLLQTANPPLVPQT